VSYGSFSEIRAVVLMITTSR